MFQAAGTGLSIRPEASSVVGALWLPAYRPSSRSVAVEKLETKRWSSVAVPDCSACVRYTIALPGPAELRPCGPMTSAPAIRRVYDRRNVAVSVVSPPIIVVWLRAPALLHDENT